MDDDGWEPVTIGRSGASVLRKGDCYLKRGPGAQEEVERLSWCRTAGIPVPEVLEVGNDYFVSGAIQGKSAAEPWPESVRPDVLRAIASFARWLHSLPVDDCPFMRGVRQLGSVAVAATSDAERGDLVRRLEKAASVERSVLTHGDLSLPNVILDPETLAVNGVVDVGRFGISDPYMDLGVTLYSIEHLNPQYGTAAVPDFLDAYGATDFDADLAELYRQLSTFT